MAPSMTFSAPATPKGSSTSGFASSPMPLRSRSVLEAAEEMDLLPQLPTPLPPLRDGVTEAHYSRWVIEEANKQVAEERRQTASEQKKFRKGQLEKFLLEQHRKVEDSHHQMAAAAASIETVRLKNLETGQEMRLNLLELKQSVHLEKQVWSAKGRELVEHAKHVQSSKVLERQLAERGKRQSLGSETKRERASLDKAREELLAADREKKQAQTARVRSETKKETVGVSSELIRREKERIGQQGRLQEQANQTARSQSRSNFLSSQHRKAEQVQASKSGAKSARAGLASYRREQAAIVRQARLAEVERKKEREAAAMAQNREVHDLLYASKFAPRDRARQVHLPGRVGKTAFNAYDPDSTPDAAAAPAADGHTLGGLGDAAHSSSHARRSGIHDDGWGD
eukprot:CAMPEP_0174699244 /NCGR_PEP_ID=MMETSP1094-20130205/4578_1 /TAXON_ID=156173 /ORGANISM="Chrysochromulina brevifilum, Strain UTEX LB 985" /LENGTH=398 /DNA_ID=CAMNT_0015896531 /DNA_START=149 /DNA_END=1345 /DNA_ORIENTATION=-